jgi:hypothetical protein
MHPVSPKRWKFLLERATNKPTAIDVAIERRKVTSF